MEAKKRLLHDIDELKIDQMQRFGARRDNDPSVRRAKDISDLLTAVKIIDERGYFRRLPRYVTDNSDSMPTVHLEDGDIRYFSKRMENMEATLSCLMHSVNNLHQAAHTTASRNTPAAVNTTFAPRPSFIKPPSASAPPPARTHAAAAAPARVNTTDRASREWGGYLSSDVLSHDELETDNDGFTEVINPRRKKRRMRSDQQQNEDKDAAGAEQGGRRDKPKPFRKPLLIGKKSNDNELIHDTVTAAKPWVNKAVFCIDNVNKSLTETDIEQFVTAMSVRVVSCHKVKARRTLHERRNNIVPTDHNTFRLCIFKDDVDALLVADKWPSDIAVSEWFFTGKKSQSAAAPVDTDIESGREAD